MSRGVPIRAISRSIAVLQCINRHGSLPMMELARRVGLPYPTACRVVQTLLHEGMVECDPLLKQYRATCMVESLSVGYREDGRLIDATHAPMIDLMRRIGWPMTITVTAGMSVIIRDSTYELSALTFSRYHRGDSFSVLDCAAGHVHLAYVDDDTRADLLRSLERAGAGAAGLEMFRSGELAERIREQRYASNDRTMQTKNPGKTSSISVPVICGDKKLAQFTMSFFASAMTMQEAIDRYLVDLHETAVQMATRYEASDAFALPHDTAAACAPKPSDSLLIESGQPVNFR